MKKQYIQPAFEQVMLETDTILAVSLSVNETSQDNIVGDVKESNESLNDRDVWNNWDNDTW